MSLKNRSARGRSPTRRASAHRSRLRVFPLFVASKTFGRSNLSFRTSFRRTLGDWRGLGRVRRDDEPSTAAATDLATLAAGIAGFVRGPLVGGALLVCRASAFAGDLTL